MLTFVIKPSSVAAVADYMENVRERVLVGIRLGMRDAMAGLARHTAENAPHLTGRLAEKIEGSAHVVETSDEIIGTVRPPGYAARLTAWAERGTKEPEVNVATALAKHARIQAKIRAGKNVSRRSAAFAEPGHAMIYDPRHAHQSAGFFASHKAFTVSGKPFLRRSLEEYTQELLGAIRARIDEAKSA